MRALSPKLDQVARPSRLGGPLSPPIHPDLQICKTKMHGLFFKYWQIALSAFNDARSSTILWLLNAPEGIFSHNSIEILKRFYPLYQYIFELCPQHVPDSLHLYSRAPLLLLLYCIPLFSSGCITRSQKNKTMLSIYSHFLFNDIKGPLDKFSCEYIR